MANTVRYQLRRIPPVLAGGGQALNLIPLDGDVLKFGRNPDHVQVVLHSTVYSNMISREHAEIKKQRNSDGTLAFFLLDQSLNGTYINEHRVKGSVLLHPGDVIKFGHVNGAAILPGTHAPQPQAEFTFVFEKQGRGGAITTDVLASMANEKQIYQQTTPAFPSPNPTHPYSANQAGQRLVAAYQQQQAASYNPALTNQALNAYHRAALLSHPAYAAALYGYTASRPNVTQQQQWPNVSQGGVSVPVCSVDSVDGGRWGFASTPAGMFPMHQVDALQQMVSNATSVTSSVICPSSTTNSKACDLVCSPPLVRAADSSALRVRSPFAHSPPLSVGTTDQPVQSGSSPAAVERIVNPSYKMISTNSEVKDIKRMECDSSVPSPPRKTDDESNMTQTLRDLASKTAENLRFLHSGSPAELVKMQHDEDDEGTSWKHSKSPEPVEPLELEEPLKTTTPPHVTHIKRGRKKKTKGVKDARLDNVQSPPMKRETNIENNKNRRKSNEVSRLLDDLTEGIFMNIVSGKKPRPQTSSSSESDVNECEKSKQIVTQPIDSPATREKEKRTPLKKRKGFRCAPAESVAGPSIVHKKDREPSSEEDSDYETKTKKKKKNKCTNKPTVIFKLVPKKSVGKPPKKAGARVAFLPAPIGFGAVHKKRGRPKKKVESMSEEGSSGNGNNAWNWHDPQDSCNMKGKCKLPQDDNIDWVECDDCNEWYHLNCVKIKVDKDSDDFHCGCHDSDSDS